MRGPKTMLFVSGGMPMPDARSVAPFSKLEQMFAAAQITLYTLYMERSPFGDLRNQVSPSAGFDDMVERDGLENATAVTGGTFMLGIGTIDQYFTRVLTELSGSYLLGVEVAPTDKDGKPHRVEVRSNRSGLEIRSRKQYLIGDAPAVSVRGDGGSLGVTAVEHVLTAARDLTTKGEIGVRATARYTQERQRRAHHRAGEHRPALALLHPDGGAADGTPRHRRLRRPREEGRRRLGVLAGDEPRAERRELPEVQGDRHSRTRRTSPPWSPPRYVKVVVYEYRSGSVGAATAKVK